MNLMFAEPTYLLLLLTIPLMLYLAFYSLGLRERDLAYLGDREVVNRLLPPFSRKRFWARASFTMAGVGMLAIAASGPRIEGKGRTGGIVWADVIIALDLSAGMKAEDVKPSRLEQGKEAVKALIERVGGKVGLATFAGSPLVVSPLTEDHNAIRLYLDLVDADLFPDSGKDIAAAVDASVNLLKGSRERAVIVVSDGGGDGRMPVSRGVPVFTLGLGTAEGGPIPIYSESGIRVGYRKDAEGREIIARLNTLSLKNMASMTGGRYYEGMEGVYGIVGELAKLSKPGEGKGEEGMQRDVSLPFLLIGVVMVVIGRVFI
jgi:Ca-activated chloride channel family protein